MENCGVRDTTSRRELHDNAVKQLISQCQAVETIVHRGGASDVDGTPLASAPGAPDLDSKAVSWLSQLSSPETESR